MEFDFSDDQVMLRNSVREFAEGEIRTAKGPVFATAIVAGVMAAKIARSIAGRD